MTVIGEMEPGKSDPASRSIENTTTTMSTSGQADSKEQSAQEPPHSLRSSKNSTPVEGISQQRDSAGRVSREERSRRSSHAGSHQAVPEEGLRPEQLRSQVNMLRNQRSRVDLSSEYTPSRSSEGASAPDDADSMVIDGAAKKTIDVSAINSESVRQALTQSLEVANSNHAYLVKALMARARLSAPSRGQSTPDVSGASTSDSNNNTSKTNEYQSPFRNLQPLKSKKHHTVMCTFFNTGDGRTPSTQSIIYQKQVPATTYRSNAVDVPRYRNIIHIERNILALNEKRLHAWPSFEDDFEGPMTSDRENELERLEKRARHELKKAYTHAQPEARDPVLARRVHARQYRSAIEQFLAKIGCDVEELIYFMIKTNTLEVPTRSKAKWRAAATKIPQFQEAESRKLRIVCEVFDRVCRYSMWHYLKITTQFHDLFVAKPKESAAWAYTKTACYSCQLHNCPFHGEYVEGSPRRKEGSSEDDDDQPANGNSRAILAKSRTSKGASGDEDLEGDASGSGDVSSDNESGADSRSVASDVSNFDDFTSINQKVNINAASMAVESLDINDSAPTSRLRENLASDDQEPTQPPCNRAEAKGGAVQGCSKSCYKVKPYLSNSIVNWDPSNDERFNHLATIYHGVASGPCIMSHIVDLPCNQIFFKISQLNKTQKALHPPKQPEVSAGIKKANGKRTLNDWLRTKTPLIHLRPSFRPCNHAGPCNDKNCSCVQQRIACEPSCFCGNDCQRKFKGCSCHQKGRPCFNSASCECFQLNRECNPDLCGTCGVREILNPLYRYNDEVTKNRCANCHIQRNKPKTTYLGNSYVAGFGLFAGEAITKNEYVGEYKGEIISRSEETRRGTMYHYKSSEFLFDLNPSHFIDATYAGNKMRFINHSSSSKFQNCYTKALLCGVDVRMGIFAKRDLNVGEELFFPYGPGYDKRTKHFREMDGAMCLPQKPAVAVKTKKQKRLKNSSALRKTTVAAATLRGLQGQSASSTRLSRLLSENETSHEVDSDAPVESDGPARRTGRQKRLRSSSESGDESGPQPVNAEEDYEDVEDSSNYVAESGTDVEEVSSDEDDGDYQGGARTSLPSRSSLRERGLLRAHLLDEDNTDESETEDDPTKSAAVTYQLPIGKEAVSRNHNSNSTTKQIPSSTRTRLQVATGAAAPHVHTSSSSPAATSPLTGSTSASITSAGGMLRADDDATARASAESDQNESTTRSSKQHKRTGNRGGSAAGRGGTLSRKRKRLE